MHENIFHGEGALPNGTGLKGKPISYRISKRLSEGVIFPNIAIYDKIVLFHSQMEFVKREISSPVSLVFPYIAL